MVVSYAVPASTGEKRRPGAVAAAGYLLFLAAASLIIYAILPLPSMSKVVDATRDAYASAGSTQPTPDQAATGARLGIIVAVVIAVVLAVLFAVIGALVLRGNRVGRILAWIFGGLGALCTICLSAGALLSGSVNQGKINGVDTKVVNDKIAAAAPSWLRPTQASLGIIILISLILVIILIAMPASNAFFRKEPEAVVINDPSFPTTPYPVPYTPPSDAPRPDAPPSEAPPSAAPPSDGTGNPPSA
jgi:hypothetical protein